MGCGAELADGLAMGTEKLPLAGRLSVGASPRPTDRGRRDPDPGADGESGGVAMGGRDAAPDSGRTEAEDEAGTCPCPCPCAWPCPCPCAWPSSVGALVPALLAGPGPAERPLAPASDAAIAAEDEKPEGADPRLGLGRRTEAEADADADADAEGGGDAAARGAKGTEVRDAGAARLAEAADADAAVPDPPL